jgi:hypothetical protein
MDIRPEHEFFGREIEFDDINNIKRVFQPGILSLPYFFDPVFLDNAMSELCGYHSSRDILVYFRNIEAIDIVSDFGKDKRKWWETFQTFAPKVKSLSAGCEMEYWYSQNGKESSSPEFKENDPPYQAFVRLFDNAIQGFSCFVSENPDKMTFTSERCNYKTIKPGEGFVQDRKSLWTGKSDIFLRSAQTLHDAFDYMKRGDYKIIGKEEMPGNKRSEVRIIWPERGALVGSLYGNNSVAFLVENDSIKKMFQNNLERRSRIFK